MTYASPVRKEQRNQLTTSTVYGFTGEQEDEATGLIYLRARYYRS